MPYSFQINQEMVYLPSIKEVRKFLIPSLALSVSQGEKKRVNFFFKKKTMIIITNKNKLFLLPFFLCLCFKKIEEKLAKGHIYS